MKTVFSIISMAAGLVAGETCEINLVVSPSGPGGGAVENRRLQELLHQALRREAEALRKLKHLNETLLAGGDRACETPTSPLAADSTYTVEQSWTVDSTPRKGY